MTTLTAFEKKARETFGKKGIKQLTIDSLLWFEREVKKNIQTSTYSSVAKFGVQKEKFAVGQVVLYKYDPKYRDELPYYDTMPLIIVTRITKKGWYGINLHYLPNRIRSWIMNQLYEVNTKKSMLERDRMRMSWAIALKAAQAVGSTKRLEHAIKQYLGSHVKSVPMVINPEAWDMVIHLPLARFKKGTPY